MAAIDEGLGGVNKVEVPADWANLVDEEFVVDQNLPQYIRDIQIPVNRQKGDTIPVSKFMPYADGNFTR